MVSNYIFIRGNSPIVAAAIHEGHQTREELRSLFNLSDEERLREEDPFTARWVNFTDNRVIVHHSRFEVDVNRPREKAVYLQPEDAWGLQVWKNGLDKNVLENSLAIYDAFYNDAEGYFYSLIQQHGHIVVFDIHSYNHRREDDKTVADPEENPEVNIGTKNMDRKWKHLVKALIDNFSSFNYDDRKLDVRENIKFKGGYFGQWLHEQFDKNVCPVSIEFKKFFMDEWTGQPFEKDIQLIAQLLEASKETVLTELKKINS
ncbi:N-formylglutamate amidohydrolase [soil metagenome]